MRIHSFVLFSIVALLSFESVSAVPTTNKKPLTDLQHETMNELENQKLVHVSPRFDVELLSYGKKAAALPGPLVSDPAWDSKEDGTKNTEELMDWANEEISVSIDENEGLLEKSSIPAQINDMENNAFEREDPSWHSKERIAKKIESLMILADKGTSFTFYQQLWMLEAILSEPSLIQKLKTVFKRKKSKQKIRKWLEIVKSKFELTTPMYNICIRTIQNKKNAQTHLLAAEFMKFIYKKGVPLPEKVNSELLEKEEKEIIEYYSFINDESSFRLITVSKSGNLQNVQELLNQPGIDVNKANYYGWTALIWASFGGHTEIVIELLKQPGIDVNHANIHGDTALIWATNNRAEIVKELLKQPGIDVNHANYYDNTALIHASYKGHLEIVKELLKQPGINVNTALIAASAKGHLEIVQELLKQPGMDVNHGDMTALIHASYKGHLQIVQELLKQPGIDVNHANNDGETALMWASKEGHSEIVQLLKENNAVVANTPWYKFW